MICRIEIDTFRTIEHAVIENIGPVICAAGRNGAGKTSFLAAVVTASAYATGNGVVNETDSHWKIAIDLFIDGVEYRYTVHRGADGVHETLLAGQELEPLVVGGKGVLSVRGSTDVKVALNARPVAAALALLPVDHKSQPLIAKFFSFMRGLRYYPLDSEVDEPAEELVRDEVFTNWEQAYNMAGDPGRSVVMRIMHLNFRRQDEFEELKSILGQDGMGLVDDILVTMYKPPAVSPPASPPNSPTISQAANNDSRHSYYGVLFKPHGNVSPVPFSKLSLGTRRLLRLFVSMIFDQSSVMLIEHPEDGIHRGLLQKVVSFIKTNADPMQFF